MLAQAHQHDIDGHPVQPCREKGVASKRCDLAVQLEKGFLCEVFGQLKIVYHAHANGKNALLVLPVELGERVVVSGLGSGHKIVQVGSVRSCEAFTRQSRKRS